MMQQEDDANKMKNTDEFEEKKEAARSPASESKETSGDDSATPPGCLPPLALPLAPQVPFFKKALSEYATASKRAVVTALTPPVFQVDMELTPPGPLPCPLGKFKAQKKIQCTQHITWDAWENQELEIAIKADQSWSVVETPKGCNPPLPLPLAPLVTFTERPSMEYATGSNDVVLDPPVPTLDMQTALESTPQGPTLPPFEEIKDRQKIKNTQQPAKLCWVNKDLQITTSKPGQSGSVMTPPGKQPPVLDPNAPKRDEGPNDPQSEWAQLREMLKPSPSLMETAISKTTQENPDKFKKIEPKFISDGLIIRRYAARNEIAFSIDGSPLMPTGYNEEGSKACVNIPLPDGKIAVIHPVKMKMEEFPSINEETKIQLGELRSNLDRIINSQPTKAAEAKAAIPERQPQKDHVKENVMNQEE